MISEISNFELPIRFPLTPSKWLIAMIHVSHSGALICIYYSDSPFILSLIMSLIVLSSLVYRHYTMVYVLRKRPSELLLNNKDEWYIIDQAGSEAEGERIPVFLLPESYVHTQLIILMFKQGRCKRTVILTPDNISKKICRRLRVRLRFSLSG